MAKKQRCSSVTLKLDLNGQPPEDLKVHAYAFDRSGRFLTSNLVQKGQVSLDISDAQAPRTRVFFGPPPPEDAADEEPSLSQMERLRAYEPTWKWDPEQAVQELKPIPEILWKPWFWCLCRIRGRVVRPISLGGTLTDLPVCHARVHICEVDRLPRFILRLPDDLILRLRDDLIRELLKPIPRPWPFPIPDPPPFDVDPGIIDPSPENLALKGSVNDRLQQVAFNPQPEPPGMVNQLVASARFLPSSGNNLPARP